MSKVTTFVKEFQHTAARRRLRALQGVKVLDYDVSTHSRPKAAASTNNFLHRVSNSFNTQPPEGGCSLYKKMIKISRLFTVFRYPLKHKEYQEV